jgi:hypothetical protein
MRHTALWSCTHIPNIIDLSREKQLFDLEVKKYYDATKLLKPSKAYFSNLKNKSNHINLNKTMCERDNQ